MWGNIKRSLVSVSKTQWADYQHVMSASQLRLITMTCLPPLQYHTYRRSTLIQMLFSNICLQCNLTLVLLSELRILPLAEYCSTFLLVCVVVCPCVTGVTSQTFSIVFWTVQTKYFLKAHDTTIHWPTYHSLITQPGPQDPKKHKPGLFSTLWHFTPNKP